MKRRVFIELGLSAGLAMLAPPTAARGQVPEEIAPGIGVPITANDFTPAGLRLCQSRVLARYGVSYHDLPLRVKAAYYEWELFRYHLTPWKQVHHYTQLPATVGEIPRWIPGSDSSTWNGALLAAMSHKYAVTREPQTLERIDTLLHGMNFFFEVTGSPGLAARNVSRADGAKPDDPRPYTAADGTPYFFRGDPAKGGYNQIAGGLAAVMMYAYPDLPPATQAMTQAMLTAMVMHVIEHGYHLTMANGQRTKYGDLRPLIGPLAVPFNAQVAYEIVALGHCFPPTNAARKALIDAEFHRLRFEEHVYYRKPWRSVVRPQRIGGSMFLKGMNDRNHVTNAAFVGLQLELDSARREQRPIDHNLMYQLGRTLYWSMDYLQTRHNSLCSFMWAALLNDPRVFDMMIKHKKNTNRGKMEQALIRGVEQLRHFNLDRFVYPGERILTNSVQWADRRRASDYQWKEPANAIWKITGQATNEVTCGTDFLYAYWLLRHFRLDQHPMVLREHGAVLGGSEQ